MIQINSEAEMLSLGRFFADQIQLPAVFELIGDVGAGKTTFTRGLAEGLGITEPVTSPSFTISKRYRFLDKDHRESELVHYDFYRLDDPGLMRDELAETLASPNTVSVIEWGGDVQSLLPASKYQLTIRLTEDGNRQVELAHQAATIEASYNLKAKQS